MYLDFEDNRPDFTPVGRAISWREGILLSIIAHLGVVVLLLLAPRLFPDDGSAARARAAFAERLERMRESPRFVFVQPKLDVPAPKPPERGEASDIDRMARTVEKPPIPTNPLPSARGNSTERVEEQQRQAARGQGPAPEPARGQQDSKSGEAQTDPSQVAKLPDSPSALELPGARPLSPQSGAAGRAATPGGSLGEALRNLQRYVQRDSFDNREGGAGAFGPAIQFDTKGVEFGPWIRRFIAQIKRNWFIPYAAMAMSGHVVITFNVHKDGSITDLTVVGPCPIEAFNNAAFGALVASNPTTALPPEYPADKAFFTVTFYYNEQPQ